MLRYTSLGEMVGELGKLGKRRKLGVFGMTFPFSKPNYWLGRLSRSTVPVFNLSWFI